jgi:hypothetical protein
MNAEDIDENNKYDIYASDDDESMEQIEEQVVSDGMISSPISSKQSDDPYQITPLIPTYANDTMEFKETGRYTPEVDNITLWETLTGGDLIKVVSETGTAVKLLPCHIMNSTIYIQKVLLDKIMLSAVMELDVKLSNCR